MSSCLTLVFALLLAPASADNAEDATKLAAKLTTDGAANFDRKDTKALAESYTEDATLTYVSKDKDSGRSKTESKRGRAEIQESYEGLFKDSGTIHSKNTVAYARLIDPDVLLITGDFEPGLNQDDLKVTFVQVRLRQDDKWLISSMQIFFHDAP